MPDEPKEDENLWQQHDPDPAARPTERGSPFRVAARDRSRVLIGGPAVGFRISASSRQTRASLPSNLRSSGPSARRCQRAYTPIR